MSDQIILFEIDRPSASRPRITLASTFRFTVMSVREAELLAEELKSIVKAERLKGAVFGKAPK